MRIAHRMTYSQCWRIRPKIDMQRILFKSQWQQRIGVARRVTNRGDHRSKANAERFCFAFGVEENIVALGRGRRDTAHNHRQNGLMQEIDATGIFHGHGLVENNRAIG